MKSDRLILTITGSDSTGGAGVQADIKTIAALGGYAVSAITSITLQNTIGIQDFFDLPAHVVAGQVEALFDDIAPRVVKIGMIRNVETLHAIADIIHRYKPEYVIYDSAIISSRGDVLMSVDVVREIEQRLLPECTLVCIGKNDAEYILHRTITTRDEMVDAAKEMLGFGCKSVLLRGGNMTGDTSTDVLMIQDDKEARFFTSPFIRQHGMGSNLSSAIATYLSLNENLAEAVNSAKSYINQQIVLSTDLVGRSSELYNDFINEITIHIKTNNDVHYYADKLNVSSRYLAQVTRRIANKTPKAIIDDYLIKELEHTLGFTDKTVQEIAYEYGFSSQAHFAKFFKKMTGQTPSEFRKKHT
ncbi:MAG: bifunctional hydroxymethylpyrimidine kinase/phosphomethylpyrimidine kinase [Prevotella sp.]|nr:bifunctional hydroxymethylpyrimidine kinase/phosphomethylpyrimidine kinase [Prevotella sp.]